MRNKIVLIIGFILAVRASAQPYLNDSYNTLTNPGGRADWSAANNVIAYDRLGTSSYGHSGYFDVWTINPDGSGNTCLTCSARGTLGAWNIGNPRWSISGNFIVFQVQMVAVPPDTAVSNGADFPGSGWQNDLWAMNRSGTQFWQLTNQWNYDGAGSGGVIYSTFSWDGTKLAWGQRLVAGTNFFGSWELAVATWSESGGTPSISGTQYYTPGQNKLYYEPHGFSLDNSTVFFMGNLDNGMVTSPAAMNIYSLNLTTLSFANLSNSLTDWAEFPEPLPASLGSNKLIYMSMLNNGRTASSGCEGDIWIMNYDGSDKQRLTFYNDPTTPYYIPTGACIVDPRWSPNGSQISVFNNVHLQNNNAGLWILNAVSGPITPVMSSVVGAGLSTPAVTSISSNGVFTIFGTQLASATQALEAGNIINDQLPTVLGGTCVESGTTRWNLYYVSPTQIDVVAGQVPTSGTVPVTVVANCGTAIETSSAVMNVPVAAATPEFLYFLETESGMNPVAAINASSNNSYIGTPGLMSGATFAPVSIGDIVTAFGVGWGATTPSEPIGTLDPVPSVLSSSYSLTLGGVAVPTSDILYIGLSPLSAGLYQVNFTVPSGVPSGNQPLVLTVDGVTTTSNAYIAIAN